MVLSILLEQPSGTTGRQFSDALISSVGAKSPTHSPNGADTRLSSAPELDFLDLSNHSQTAYAPGAEAQFSPDGKWIAFIGAEPTTGGDADVYVSRFPGPGRRIQISIHGGAQPRWRGDGRELFYITIDKKPYGGSDRHIALRAGGRRSPRSFPDTNRRGGDRTIPICRLPRRQPLPDQLDAICRSRSPDSADELTSNPGPSSLLNGRNSRFRELRIRHPHTASLSLLQIQMAV
jgi:hypothetical protein